MARSSSAADVSSTMAAGSPAKMYADQGQACAEARQRSGAVAGIAEQHHPAS
jgi:hypothetical protein